MLAETMRRAMAAGIAFGFAFSSEAQAISPQMTLQALDARLSERPLPPAADLLPLARDHVIACEAAWGDASIETNRCRIREAEVFVENEMYPEVDALLRALLSQPALQEAANADVNVAAQALMGVTLRNSGKAEEAEHFLVNAVELAGVHFGSDDARTLRHQTALASTLVDLGRFDETAALLDVIEAKAGGAKPALSDGDVGRRLVVRGRLLHRTGEPAAAVDVLLEAERLLLTEIAPDDPQLTQVLTTLGLAQLDSAQYEPGISTLRSVVAIYEATTPPRDGQSSSGLNNLALGLARAGRLKEAEVFSRRALDIDLKLNGPLSGKASNRYHTYSSILERLGRLDEALEAREKGIAAAKASIGSDHPNFAHHLQAMASLQLKLGNAVAAESYARSAVELRLSKGISAAASPVSQARLLLASALSEQGRFDDALEVLDTDEVALTNSRGPAAPGLGQTLVRRAEILKTMGRDEDAYTAAREAIYPLRNGLLTGATVARSGDKDSPVMVILEAASGSRAPDRVETAWEALQLVAQSEAASAFETTAKRFSGVSPDVAANLDQRRRLAQLVNDAELAGVAAYKSLDEDAIRKAGAAIVSARADLEAADAKLAGLDPALASISGRSAAEIDAFDRGPSPILRPGEAFLQMSQGADALFVVLVTRKSRQFIRLPIGAEEMRNEVDHLRAGLTITQAVSATDLPDYDLEAAEALYDRLFSPLSDALSHTKVLIVAADGPLAELPLAVLVERAGNGSDPFARYRRTRWAADRFQFVTVPSAGALSLSRTVIRPSDAARPFLAFADPSLGGDIDLQTSIQFAELRGDAPAEDAGATVRTLCRLRPLPDTRREALALAVALSAGADSVRTGRAATETALGLLNSDGTLADHRILLFATHGLAATPSALSEPALVLTPANDCAPGLASDDGLLLASEIARLTLNADWVVLSGCNTAAGTDSSSGALSGLARAFFAAGARRMLVSHWAIDSNSSADLIIALFDTKNEQVNAEDLYRVMRNFRRSRGNQAYRSHPAFWAPFVIVGADP